PNPIQISYDESLQSTHFSQNIKTEPAKTVSIGSETIKSNGDLEVLIPEKKQDIILNIFIKMHSRKGRYKNRATLAWLKKELANDFPQESISDAWKWLVKSDFVEAKSTSIFINEKSEALLKKIGKF
ncbi:MAG: hypothetical protein ACTSYB_10995, partial [Candidatus Helarchaeota archaeon]